MMKKYLGFVAVSAFLFSCAEIERDNQYDMRAGDNYIPKEGSSSSVVSSSSSVEPSSSSALPSSSSGAESSSSTAPSSSSVVLSSSSVLPSSSSEPKSSSSSSSSYGGLCAGFVEGTIRENHYGKDKKQFCDERDGKKYVYVKISGQTWMAENLNYDPGTGKSACYDKQPSNCTTYGRLYDWSTALTVCPSGWHLPSDSEWDVLVNYAGGSSAAGGKLKATSGWNNSSNETDDYEFSALPGGFGGSDGSFRNVGYDGRWWSATEDNANYAYYRDMLYSLSTVYRDYSSKSYLYSVRCVQD